jgi:aryl-alcohol dehydrogenase-like predicted oxidoreductase
MDVSRICLGCMGFGDPERTVHKWVLSDESSQPIIKKALELGINFFDTANVYASGTSEEIIGRGLKDFANRDEVVIATKVHGKMHDGPNGAGLSRKAILSEINKSLKRLGTDYTSPRSMAGPASSRCRITSTSSTAKRSGRCCRSVARRKSG